MILKDHRSFAEGFRYYVYWLLIKKLNDVIDNVSHPFHDRLLGELISKSGRKRLPSTATIRYLSTFVL